MGRPPGIVDFTPDPQLYPFTSRWFDSSVGPVHYIDEGGSREGDGTGPGPTVLLLHGNPDWSFLYRKIITALVPEVRCVAPDYPGFGLSVHPAGYGYTPAEHAEVIGELVRGLDLRDLVVMGQDWGGPIGMDLASREPERVRGLVMGNTWFWPGDEFATKAFSRVMGSPPVQWLIRHRNVFVTVLMRRTLQVKLSDAEWAHYTDVVPTPESREGIAVFPREILGAHEWLGELEQRVDERLAGTPASLVFGKKDPALASDGTIRRWRETFPDATCVELPDAGHYIQEDDPEACATAIREMLATG